MKNDIRSEIEELKKRNRNFNSKIIKIEVLHLVVALVLAVITIGQLVLLNSQNKLINTQTFIFT